MDIELVVIEQFSDYAKGAVITDADKIAEILGSESQLRVVKRAAAAAPTENLLET